METGDLKAVPGFGFLPRHVVAVTNLLFQVPRYILSCPLSSTGIHFHFIIKENASLIHFHFLINKHSLSLSN